MPPRRQQALPHALGVGSEQDAGETLSVEHPEGFVQVPDSLLLNPQASDGCIRLYSVLKHHARKSSKSYPGRPRLARLMGVKSVRTVDARINELIELGFLIKTARYRAEGGQSTNHYHLLFYPRPPVMAQRAAASASEMDVDGSTVGTAQVAGRDSAGEPQSANCAASNTVATTRERPDAAAEKGEQWLAPCNELPGVDATNCEGSVHSNAGERSRSFLRHNPRPSPADTPALDVRGTGEGVEDEDRLWAEAVVEHLPEALYPRSRSEFRAALDALRGADEQVRALEPRVTAEKLVALRPLPAVVTSPVGLLRNRLDDLWVQAPAPAWPQWCGHCDSQSRQRWDDGLDVLARCPDCHPRRQEQADEATRPGVEPGAGFSAEDDNRVSSALSGSQAEVADPNGSSIKPTSLLGTPLDHAESHTGHWTEAAGRADDERSAAIAAARMAIIESRGGPR